MIMYECGRERKHDYAAIINIIFCLTSDDLVTDSIQTKPSADRFIKC